MIETHGKPSQSAQRHNRLVPQPKPRPGLAVDTSFVQHQGQIPLQIYPEHKAKQQSFVSLSDLKAIANVEDGRVKSRRGFKERLGKATRTQPLQKSIEGSNNRQRLAVDNRDVSEAPPPYQEFQARLLPQAPPQSRRTNGLQRPAPLNLNTDVSPSDRAIPIGIALSSAAIQDHRTTLESAIPRADSMPQGWLSHQIGQELTTPTIIITPAEEDFEAKFNASPDNFSHSNGYRSGSNGRSRHTDYKSNGRQFGQTQPVPPLPLFAVDSQSAGRGSNARDSVQTIFDEPSPQYSESERTGTGLPVCTASEDQHTAQLPSATAFPANRKSSQADVPTPRRSKGWWNVITSPFSASSASRGFPFRSPPILEEDGRGFDLVLTGGWRISRSDASMFASRPEGDDELRSAPPTDCSRSNFDRRRIATPKRSDTAPGALDLGNAGEVNIYRTPSQGAASSYFDRNNRYSTRAAPPPYDPASNRGLEPDWSPSQSVYRGSEGPMAMNRGLGNGDRNDWPMIAGGEAAPYYDTSVRYSDMDEPVNVRRDLGSYRANGREYPSQTQSDTGFEGQAFVESPIRADLRDDRMGGTCAGNSLSPGRSPNLTGPQYDPFADGAISRNMSLRSPSYGEDPHKTMRGIAATSFVDASPANMPNFNRASYDDDYNTNMTPSAGHYDKGDPEDKGTPGFSNFSGTHPAAENDFLAGQRQFDEHSPVLFSASNDVRTPYDYGSSAHSPTPVLEDARAARFVDPRSANANTRELDYDRETLSGSAPELGPSARNAYPESGLRNDSRARGGYRESDFRDESCEAEMYPPPRPFNEKACQPMWDESFVHDGVIEGEDFSHPWYRRFFWLLIGGAALAVILLVALLIIFIPSHHDNLPVEAQWVNLTGFPPLATGVATVIGAKSVKDVNGCVNPAALWSCGVPPGQGLSTTQPDQPNFRVLIRFRNDTLSNETLLEPANSTLTKRHPGQTTDAGDVTKRGLSVNYLFASSPSPPSTEDQIFLGRTTDNVHTPFNGEETPFYISLLDPIALQPVKRSRLHKRDFRYPYPTPSDSHPDNSGSSTPASGFPTPSASTPKNIPQPSITGDGEPVAPQLYPLVYAQPLRLFNRGLPTEHYGFYTYFDRSIYIAGSVSNASVSNAVIGKSILANVPLDKASAVCTWSQTRFLVQIWTRKTDATGLAFMSNATSIPAVNSTANNMEAPGSFPYSVTVTLDRHGGDASQKGVYCYGLDGSHRVVDSSAMRVTENRAFDGTVVNPAAIPMNNGTSLSKRDDRGGNGIDGGTGGCTCQWRNS